MYTSYEITAVPSPLGNPATAASAPTRTTPFATTRRWTNCTQPFNNVCQSSSADLAVLRPCLLAQNSDALLRKVDDHYNHLSSLRARYTEHYAGMGMDRTESGTLLLKKPGRMRWTYDQPPARSSCSMEAWLVLHAGPIRHSGPAKQLDDLRSPLRFLLGTPVEKELDS